MLPPLCVGPAAWQQGWKGPRRHHLRAASPATLLRGGCGLPCSPAARRGWGSGRTDPSPPAVFLGRQRRERFPAQSAPSLAHRRRAGLKQGRGPEHRAFLWQLRPLWLAGWLPLGCGGGPFPGCRQGVGSESPQSAQQDAQLIVRAGCLLAFLPPQALVKSCQFPVFLTKHKISVFPQLKEH